MLKSKESALLQHEALVGATFASLLPTQTIKIDDKDDMYHPEECNTIAA